MDRPDQSFDRNKAVQHARRLFERSIEVKRELLRGTHLEVLVQMSDAIAGSVAAKGKVLLCGNGGSAADAQHLAAELLIRLHPHINRQALPAIALAVDSSTLTACGNDFGFEYLYERMVRALGRQGDVLIAISTSGNSANVVRALEAARADGITTLGFLGSGGGRMLALCDMAFVVPSSETGRIQEAHITAGHALMELVEDRLIREGFLFLTREA